MNIEVNLGKGSELMRGKERLSMGMHKVRAHDTFE